jgi:glycosyltransferase involved in cell wall biosynthesis
MHVLLLTERFTWKKNSGWALRKHSLLDVLATMGTVDMVITNPVPEQERPPLLDFLQKRCRQIYLPPSQTHWIRRWRQRYLRLAGLTGYRMSVLQTDDRVVEHIQRAIQTAAPDIILFESAFVSQYIHHIPADLRGRCVMSPHNVESEIEWEYFAAARGVEKFRSWVRYVDIRRLEATDVAKFKWIAPVSGRDALYYRFICPEAGIVVLPNVVDVQKYPFVVEREDTSLLFIGSLNWKYNRDGLYWFIERVLPIVMKSRPGTTLEIVGRAGPADLERLGRYGQAVRVVGPAADVESYFKTRKAFVCPLFAGSGTRLKLIEAFASGIPVVSTSKGCEGLGASHGQHLYIADSEEAFSEAILRVLSGERNDMSAMVHAARQHAEQYLSHEALRSAFVELYQAMATSPSG